MLYTILTMYPQIYSYINYQKLSFNFELNLKLLTFCFNLGVLSDSAQGLLLLLKSGITHGGVQQTRWSIVDLIQICHKKDKCPTHQSGP